MIGDVGDGEFEICSSNLPRIGMSNAWQQGYSVEECSFRNRDNTEFLCPSLCHPQSSPSSPHLLSQTHLWQSELLNGPGDPR